MEYGYSLVWNNVTYLNDSQEQNMKYSDFVALKTNIYMVSFFGALLTRILI